VARSASADLWRCVVADRGGGGGGGGGGRRPAPTNSVRSQPTPSAPVDLTADAPVFHDGVLKANVSWAFERGTLHTEMDTVCANPCAAWLGRVWSDLQLSDSPESGLDRVRFVVPEIDASSED